MTTPSAPPDVSVIIAAWNRGDKLRPTIASALASRDISIEVIAIDDASPDTTFEVIQDIAAQDKRVRYDRLAVNSGPSGARNRAIDLARGEFIAVLDADDSMAPERLAHMMACARATGADIVIDNLIAVDEDGRKSDSRPFLKSSAFRQSRPVDLATWVRFNTPARGRDSLGYLKPLIRRSFLDRMGLRYDPELRNGEDYDLIARLLACGAHMHFTSQAGYFYQRAQGSISHRLTPQQTRGWIEADIRFADRFSSSLDPAARRALMLRRQALKDAHLFICAVDAIKQGKGYDLPRLFLKSPMSAPFSAGVLSKIALGKVIGRRLV
ncbi:MAG: glycosyltransferase family 2 protein [Alphaproteobacteria bacterium]|nr:glycosyltransferase family 2 protein [Alphaproteobacteria bacterium]